MSEYAVSVIAGDGIGPEVMPEAIRCVDAVAPEFGFQVRWRRLDWGSDRYLRTGSMMPDDGLDLLAEDDAILLGAVGVPEISDVTTLWGLLIPIRRRFEQYVNLRPAKTLDGVRGNTARPFDLVIVRENTEGEYSEIGGRINRGLPDEMALQTATFSRKGVTRVARYAMELAGRREHRVTSATKSNGLIHSMPFWDEVVTEVAAHYPEVVVDQLLVDALAAKLVESPDRFDVIVASNLFGDILSDLTAALSGSIGVAPSANINPEREHPSMFEPVHGSAPDIAGQGVANPVGQIWAAAMMLDHLGEPAAAARIVDAFEAVLRAGISTPDLGGSASTREFTDHVLSALGTEESPSTARAGV
ncbi:MAG TPA: tartrate dehydrogenase [Pseudolysinimonas sp.]|jgi:tartrate dehydrogenase/decarboxylase/D-malate dehydrogenase